MATTSPTTEQLVAPERRRVSTIRRLSRAHPVAAFLVRRLLTGLVALIIASMLIYVAVEVLPGNVVSVVLGKSATPTRIADITASLHLDQSLPVRYVHFVGNLLTGNLGYSTAALVQGQHQSVWSIIHTPLRNSFVLAGLTFLLFIPLSLIFGTLAALRAGRAADHSISTVALALGSMPEFLTGMLLIVIFFTQLHLLPPIDEIGTGQTPFTQPTALIMPVATLLAVSLAFAIRMVRATTVETLRANYVVMARLNGYRERRVIWRYALRNALAPSVQALALTAQYLVGGIIVTESVFDYPGIGNLLVQAVSVRDIQEVAVIATLLAAVYIVINVLADLMVMLLVPKLRTQA